MNLEVVEACGDEQRCCTLIDRVAMVDNICTTTSAMGGVMHWEKGVNIGKWVVLDCKDVQGEGVMRDENSFFSLYE